MCYVWLYLSIYTCDTLRFLSFEASMLLFRDKSEIESLSLRMVALLLWIGGGLATCLTPDIRWELGTGIRFVLLMT